MPKLASSFLLILTLLLAVPQQNASANEFEVQFSDGRVLRGPLVHVTAMELTVRVEDEEIVVPVSETNSVRQEIDEPLPVPPTAAHISSIDGSLLVGDFSVQQSTARVDRGEQEVRMPTSDLHAVRFKSLSPAQLDEWSKIVERPAEADLLVLIKGERLDFAEGVLRDIDADQVDFELDGELVQVPRARVAGIVYFHGAPRALPPRIATIEDHRGSRLEVERLELRDDVLHVNTPAGLHVPLPLSEIAQFDFSVDKFVYLGELKPLRSEWTPYFEGGRLTASLGQLFRPRTNRPLPTDDAPTGDAPMQLRHVSENGVSTIQSYAKGISLHSRTELTFALPEKFRRLQALAGIDARLGNQGHVRLVISGDDRELWSGEISGNDPPRPLDIDISGVRKLTLLVDFGRDFDLGDHLNLCDARLIK